MRVTRRCHPFEGRVLTVLGGMRRHGVLELLVVLPDGSKALMPAGWTDVRATECCRAFVLRSTAPLMMQTVYDRLRRHGDVLIVECR